jgi:probable O-glycosylation ligase (exosortase A-associated)
MNTANGITGSDPGAIKPSGMLAVYALMLALAIDYLGLGYDFPIINVIKLPIATMLGLLIYVLTRNEIGELLKFRQTKILLAFMALTFLSLFHALITIRVVNSIKLQVGYMFLFVVAYFVLSTDKSFLILFRVMVGLHVYLVIFNYEKLFPAVRAGNFRAGYFLSDGNDFAWSLAVYAPFALLLAAVSKKLSGRLIWLAAYAIMAIGILGTFSRGAFIAMASALFYFGFSGKNKKLGFLMLALLLIGILIFAPVAYKQRIASIKDYGQDSSAMNRITAWKAATNMALDYPIGVGAGNFNSVYGRYYKGMYADPHRWGSQKWISAHSIYFLVLAEYGFLGLILLLTMLGSTFFENRRSMRMVPAIESPMLQDERYFIFLNMSLLSYCACGVFLGGINYPHLHLLLALTLRSWTVARSKLAGGAVGDDPTGSKLLPVR